MATVIDNPNEVRTERIVERDSSAGWAIAVLILLVVIAAGIFYWARYRTPAPAQPAPQGASVQVNLPTSGTSDTGSQGAGQGTPNSDTSPSNSTNPAQPQY